MTPSKLTPRTPDFPKCSPCEARQHPRARSPCEVTKAILGAAPSSKVVRHHLVRALHAKSLTLFSAPPCARSSKKVGSHEGYFRHHSVLAPPCSLQEVGPSPKLFSAPPLARSPGLSPRVFSAPPFCSLPSVSRHHRVLAPLSRSAHLLLPQRKPVHHPRHLLRPKALPKPSQAQSLAVLWKSASHQSIIGLNFEKGQLSMSN